MQTTALTTPIIGSPTPVTASPAAHSGNTTKILVGAGLFLLVGVGGYLLYNYWNSTAPEVVLTGTAQEENPANTETEVKRLPGMPVSKDKIIVERAGIPQFILNEIAKAKKQS